MKRCKGSWLILNSSLCAWEATPMMGSKERSFAPLVNVSLEELVPHDHFYRHLDRTLNLSFVREFVQETYAGGGRPSIDPIVFFKLHLVMFFEGIRAARQLMRHAVDRLSVRWFIGYDLDEPLPDHSSLTASAHGIAWRFFVASLTRLWNSESLQGWSGGRSCTSMALRCMPMPRRTRSSRAFLSRPI